LFHNTRDDSCLRHARLEFANNRADPRNAGADESAFGRDDEVTLSILLPELLGV
jgi:hypothetical protein